MLPTVEGVYDNGRVELTERPIGVGRAKVYVTFVIEGPAAEGARADAVDGWVASLREGLPLGGPPYPTRDDLYDRDR
jgi:hypothetical protein